MKWEQGNKQTNDDGYQLSHLQFTTGSQDLLGGLFKNPHERYTQSIV